LVGGSKYQKERSLPRCHLAGHFGRTGLEKIVQADDFCHHLPLTCRRQFANLLLGLWGTVHPFETSSFGVLLKLSDGFLSSVPDIPGLRDSVCDMTSSQHFLGAACDPASAMVEPEVQKKANEILSCIRAIDKLCLCFRNVDTSVLEGSSEQLKKPASKEDNTPRSSSARQPDAAEAEQFAWAVCADQLERVTQIIENLCTSCESRDCQSPEHREASTSFVQDDKKLMLLHPGTCGIFLRSGLCRELGIAITKLIEARNYLNPKLERDREAQASPCCLQKLEDLLLKLHDANACKAFLQANCCHTGSAVKKFIATRENLKAQTSGTEREARVSDSSELVLEGPSGLLRRIDKIESLIMLILEQCAVVRSSAFYISFLFVIRVLKRFCSTEKFRV
jgi:hypothetical protein